MSGARWEEGERDEFYGQNVNLFENFNFMFMGGKKFVYGKETNGKRFVQSFNLIKCWKIPA